MMCCQVCSADVHVGKPHIITPCRIMRRLLEWYRSTGMKPYLDRLDEAWKVRFMDRVLQKIRIAYPVQADGHVRFPFRRVFFTAKRASA
jgi:trans-aconitate methyltransferase